MSRPRIAPRDDAHAATLARWRQYKTQAKARRRAEGLCVDGDCVPIPGEPRCDYHREANAERRKRVREAQKAARRALDVDALMGTKREAA